jgi:hypothetical protein
MPELHPAECACQDCWSRRLIRDAGPATEPYSDDELEDFGHLLKARKVSEERD